MNKRPIEQAKDPKLRSSLAALKLAARDARRIAAQTGTAIVIEVDGRIVHVRPKLEDDPDHVVPRGF